MCTVLQQHLNQTNGFAELERATSPRNQSTSTPSTAGFYRHVSPVRYTPAPTYSYLQVRPNFIFIQCLKTYKGHGLVHN